MLAVRAARLEKKAKAAGLYGVFDWLAILSALLPLLGSCKKPVKPAPVNPTPNPTPAQAEAWEKAWHLKSAAVDNFDGAEYAPATVRRTAAQIRRTNRRDGTPVKKPESMNAAVFALDDARTSPMSEMYHDVLEAQHAS